MPMPKPSRMRAPNRAASRSSAASSHPGAARAEHRLGDHQTQIVRHAVVETPAPVRGRIGTQAAVRPRRRPGRPRSAPRRVGTSSAHRSKVPPLARSKRAWCQWQVRMPSWMLPLCKREAEMRAAIVQSEHAALVVDHEQRAAPAFDDHAPLGCELGERADANEAIRIRLHEPRLIAAGSHPPSRAGAADRRRRSPPGPTP